MAKKYLTRFGDAIREIEVVEEGPGGLQVCLDGECHVVRLEQVGRTSLYALVIDDRPHELFAVERAGGFDIVIGPQRFPVAVGAPGRRSLPPLTGQQPLERPAEAGGWLVLSPMTGAVVEVYVAKGDQVAVGDLLLAIEAMKMNNELRAQRAGTVGEVYVSKGQRVEQGSPLFLMA